MSEFTTVLEYHGRHATLIDLDSTGSGNYVTVSVTAPNGRRSSRIIRRDRIKVRLVYTEDRLSVCRDCFDAVAFFDREVGRNQEPQRKLIDANWKVFGEDAHHSIEVDDDPERELGFSSSSCDGCGSNLAGDRYAALVMVRR